MRNCVIWINFTNNGIYYKKRKIVEDYIDKFNKENPEIYEKFEKIPQYYIINSVLQINSFLDNYSMNLYDGEINIDFGVDDYSFNIFLDYLVSNLNRKLFEIKKGRDCWEISVLMKYLTQLEDIEKVWKIWMLKTLSSIHLTRIIGVVRILYIM